MEVTEGDGLENAFPPPLALGWPDRLAEAEKCLRSVIWIETVSLAEAEWGGLGSWIETLALAPAEAEGCGLESGWTSSAVVGGLDWPGWPSAAWKGTCLCLESWILTLLALALALTERGGLGSAWTSFLSVVGGLG